jgi:small subunit ribosomal protein S9
MVKSDTPIKHKAAKTAKPAEKAEAKKPRAPKKKPVEKTEVVNIEPIAEAVVTEQISIGKPTISGGRYVFATGRRKTAVANIRLFSGKGNSLINKKPVEKYFGHAMYRDEFMKPLELTGLTNDFYFTATVNGGGTHAQSQAVRHGLSQALAGFNDEIKRVLKKNSFLTRDDRKKERNKPGLKGARRSPQWAKR